MCLCLHAEQNVIAQAAYCGVSIAGAALYSTHLPCLACTKLILESGLIRVVFKAAADYNAFSHEILKAAGKIWVPV